MYGTYKERKIMALASWVKSFLTAASTTAANAALASEPARTVATAAEMRAGTSTTVRAFNPSLFAEAGGTTAARPTDAGLYFRYFDTTLGKPVFLKTQPSGWVDATGTAA